MISRQRKWQKKKIREGNCKICGKKQTEESKEYCKFHLDQFRSITRKSNRNRYRRLHNIPLDAPLYSKKEKNENI